MRAVLFNLDGTLHDRTAGLQAFVRDQFTAGMRGDDVGHIAQAGQTAAGSGLIISASRSILYTSQAADFDVAARKQALWLKQLINSHRKKHATTL